MAQQLWRRFSLLLMAAAMILAAGLPASAQSTIDKPLDDPALEARARALHKQLRCLVCQNQSIDDSNADLARDLRVLVRQRLADGDSDQEALDYLVRRYGDWVLLNPPFKTRTAVLWFGPLVIFTLAAGGIVVVLRRRRRETPSVQPAPLNEKEQARLREMLDDGPGEA